MASLSPLDLLSMSTAEQKVLRCLAKQPQLSVADLTRQTGIPLAEIEEILNSLRRRSHVVEQLHNGKRVFSTRFQFGRTSVRNMPAGLLNLLTAPPERFFSEVPLTALLPDKIHQVLSQSSQERSLLPNEILGWQGEKLNFVAVVYTGLLVKTRLKGQQVHEKSGYIRRTEWLGISEVFSESAIIDTYTAVTETTLLTWTVAEFLNLLRQHNELALAVSHHLSQLLKKCQQTHLRGQGYLWAIEGAHPGAGVTTFATNLARLTGQNENSARNGRVLLWNLKSPHLESNTSLFSRVGPPIEAQVGMARILEYPDGVDILTHSEHKDYPAQVQLDILLGDLLTQYKYIICDTGHDTNDEQLLHLRGRAHTLITLTQNPSGAEAAIRQWNRLQPYSAPGQKRVLALNGATSPPSQLDPKFHLVIPEDSNLIEHAQMSEDTLDKDWLHSPLMQALQEVYRRLSLNHTLAIFVPSTINVDRPVDNAVQVQAALSFLGDKFGGATSSDAEGVWRSEDSSLVTEQVTVVRTFVSQKALEKYLDDVLSFASDLKRIMKQEAVAISVDNQLILV